MRSIFSNLLSRGVPAGRGKVVSGLGETAMYLRSGFLDDGCGVVQSSFAWKVVGESFLMGSFMPERGVAAVVGGGAEGEAASA